MTVLVREVPVWTLLVPVDDAMALIQRVVCLLAGLPTVFLTSAFCLRFDLPYQNDPRSTSVSSVAGDLV